MKSESFRAFDRRPLEPREEQPHGGGATTSAPNNIMVRGNGSNTSFQDAIMCDGDVATTSAQNNIMGPRSSSPETSYSGEDHSDYPETNLDNNCNIVADPQPPLWDWEQLNWLWVKPWPAAPPCSLITWSLMLVPSEKGHVWQCLAFKSSIDNFFSSRGHECNKAISKIFNGM